MKQIYRSLKKYAKASVPGIYSIIDKYKVVAKYLISGCVAATTDLSLLFIFTDLAGLWYVFSAAIAFAAAFFVSFFLQKFWTFRDNTKDRMRSQMAVYLSIGLINLGVNSYGLYLLVEYLSFWYLLAQVVMGALIAVYSFLIYNFFIFRKKNTEDTKTGSAKILIATGIFPPDIGGPATYVKILEEELPKYGWQIKVVTYSDSAETQNHKFKIQNNTEIQNSNVQIYKISREQNKLLRYLKYFWQVYKLNSWADIVYAQGPVSEGYPVYLACKLRRKPYILKIVGDYAWEQMQVGRDGALPRLGMVESNFITPDDFQNKKFNKSTEKKRKVEHKVAQNANKIIVPSEYLKKIVKQWGVDEIKINVIYNAVEFKNIEPASKPNNERWLVSVGRLTPWKGMSALIDVLKILNIKYLPAGRQDLILNIIGEGVENENLKSKIKDLKLENKVRFLGKLPHDEVMSYVKSADIFVLNTGYEGLSHTVLEAMNLGVPIITTNVCGNPEVVENNKTGLLVEYNNKEQIKRAILKLLNNGELRGKLVNNAKQSLVKFNKQEMIKNTIEILKQ